MEMGRKASKARRETLSKSAIPQHENTYRMEPRRRFQSFRAKRIAEEVVRRWLNEESEYSAEFGRDVAKIIAIEIKDKLKSLHYERYRFVVQCYVGQKRHQGVQLASRALTDACHDSFDEFSYENRTMWCSVVVHAVYLD